ncbi:ATP-binding protein [Neorhizobium sp. T25_27]|uniref:ATP-binding protein n=1 Tax=Neorhizobium sp. T25_27 TaxID=2093831 RepID=UPI000CF95D9C|nr:ATP-binding protein [Neorhizobium sp. T25_27]
MNNVVLNGRAASSPDHRSPCDARDVRLDGVANDVEIINMARMSLVADLSDSISHQVNDSLSAIVMDGETSLALLNRESLELERVRNVARRIMSTARKASENVRRIRGLASNESRERVLVNMNYIAAEAVAILQGRFDREMITLSVDLADDLSLISGDTIQLQQLVLNLLVNRIQAISEEGSSRRKLELTTRQGDGDFVLLAVRDSGRASTTRRQVSMSDWFPATKMDGAEVSLSVCRLIAIAHGGTFIEHGQPDGWTEIVLAIPGANCALAQTA